MGQIGTKYDARDMALTGLALTNGTYAVHIWKPVASGGLVSTNTGIVREGTITIRLPSFTDDLAVHLYQPAANRAIR